MIRQLHDESEYAQGEHRKMYGGYNDFPPGWREIDAKEFAQSRHFLFEPSLVEFRQMIERTPNGLHAGKPALSVHLQWQRNGIGFAIVNDFHAGTIKFYTFGKTPEGYVEHFDSSD